MVPGRGSSPLARGLHVKCLDGSTSVRIIPARAGFTRSAPVRESGSGDHPRSRGVYEYDRAAAAHYGGSSPLARGLPVGTGPGVRSRGIIPARAGFTSAPFPTVPTIRDHPRSRGVYACEETIGIVIEGSSPLARGLPRAARSFVAASGIIPARAGFTSDHKPSFLGRLDHPRSRGVYEALDAHIEVVAGSSPLARGLLVGRGDRPAGPGIIPARAGFTHDPL